MVMTKEPVTREEGQAPQTPSASVVYSSNSLFYRIVRAVFNVLGALWFRLEPIGRENVPEKGGVLLISNHASNLDPPLAVIRLKRQCHILAKEELFHNGIFGYIIARLHAHPVHRGGMDRKALRDCLDILKQGNMLLLFPEGTRTRDGELQECKAGGAMIALQAGVPIVPVYIDGSFDAMPRGVSFPRPRKVRVYYGEAFNPSEVVTGQRREAYESLAKVMMERIAQLRDKARK